MIELFAVLAPFQLAFLSFIIIYGCFFGVGNILLRIKLFFTGRKMLQSDLGKLLDGVFIFSIIVLIILNF